MSADVEFVYFSQYSIFGQRFFPPGRDDKKRSDWSIFVGGKSENIQNTNFHTVEGSNTRQNKVPEIAVRSCFFLKSAKLKSWENVSLECIFKC